MLMVLYLGYFERNIYLFLAQKGYEGFAKVFWMKKHNLISFSIMIA